MLNKKIVGALLLATMAVSTTALAQDRGFNTVAGAVIGAAIGNSTHDRNGALIGGVLGAAVGNSIQTNDRYDNRGYSNVSYNNGGYVDNRSSYYDDRARYYQPAPVYVEQRPVYYAPAPTYYYNQPSAVVYVGGGGDGYYEGRHGGYGYGHGYGHGHRR